MSLEECVADFAKVVRVVRLMTSTASQLVMTLTGILPLCCVTSVRGHVPFCSLAVLDPMVGHTVDVLSPFISVLCHSGGLFHAESCPRLDVVHPGRAWPSSPACTWRALSLSPCFLML